MPTNEERREAAKRKLSEQLESRARKARQRRIMTVAVAVIALTWPPVRSLAMRCPLDLEQTARTVVDHQHDISAAAAIRTIGPAERFELLAMD